MKGLVLALLVLLLSACAARSVRCDTPLRPINRAASAAPHPPGG